MAVLGFSLIALRYILAAFEALAVIAISCVWRVVSFKYTHLVERIGLLTLIIMGEGIIGMTKSVSVIVKNSNVIGSNLIGTIVSAVLVIVRLSFPSLGPLLT